MGLSNDIAQKKGRPSQILTRRYDLKGSTPRFHKKELPGTTSVGMWNTKGKSTKRRGWAIRGECVLAEKQNEKISRAASRYNPPPPSGNVLGRRRRENEKEKGVLGRGDGKIATKASLVRKKVRSPDRRRRTRITDSVAGASRHAEGNSLLGHQKNALLGSHAESNS